MITALILIVLGVFTQIILLTTTRNVLPRFHKNCLTCGHQMPPTERALVIHDCPECERLVKLGVNLSDALPQAGATEFCGLGLQEKKD